MIKKLKILFKKVDLSRFLVAGSVDIVDLLLEDKRSDPSLNNNGAIISAYDVLNEMLLEVNKDGDFEYIENLEKIILSFWNDNRVRSTIQKDNVKLYNQMMKKEIKEKISNF